MGKANSGKGQVSAEMIILIAALAVVVLILAKQMSATAVSGAKKLNATADYVFDQVDKQLGKAEKKDAGESCAKDAECKSGSCSIWDGRCE